MEFQFILGSELHSQESVSFVDRNLYVLGDTTRFRPSFENHHSFTQNLINSLPGMFPLNSVRPYKVVAPKQHLLLEAGA